MKTEARLIHVAVDIMLRLCSLQDIIQRLIENSSTFRDKTEYAQDKYIKKKKKK